jgi:predicted ATPase/class 3 adenylate cyclase
MPELPTGTVTLLFTDIEGSTRLLEELKPERYADALERHRDLLRRAFSERGGYEVDYEGDSFFVSFQSAANAVDAALAAQRALAVEDWPAGYPLRARMGLHTGEPLAVPPKYVGLDVHRAARIMAAGHGDQVLLSGRTASLAEEALPRGCDLRDLGEHRLKDLSGKQRLYQLVAEGLRSEFPPLRTLELRANNLPVQPNRLIGRSQEIRELTDLLRGPETRLVTLTGPGGTGKTRVALEAAAELIDDFADGVFVAFLASVRDPDLVLQVVAQTLGLRQRTGEQLVQTLAAYLGERQILLLLDNFEHLLECAGETAELLATSPRLKMLITSREPLRLAAERVFEVPPLTAPHARLATAAEALEHDSVILFVERAAAATGRFRLDDEDAAAVADICARLDGLPLAIELAAARARSLSPRAFQRRLSERLTLLTGGARDLDERQRTLRATIGWSYDLLTEEERTLFANLAVFVGGCRLEAAEAVCDPDGVLGKGLFDATSSLVEKSLLHRRDDPDGEPRFWMLETIREYAQDQLRARGDETTLRLAHAHYFLDLAERGEIELRGKDQLAWLDRLESEYGNIREVLRWALASSPELALRMTGALYLFWEIRGHWNEGIRWSKESLERVDDPPRGARARALFSAAFVSLVAGEYEDGIALLEKALPLFEQSRDTESVAHAFNELAWLNLFMGERVRALEWGEKARALAREIVDPWLTGQALLVLGAVCTDVREDSPRQIEEALKKASAHYAEAIELFEQVGDEIHSGRARTNLGWIALLREEYGQARHLFEDARDVGIRMGDDFSAGNNLSNLALAALLDGTPDEAEAFACAFLERFLERGDKRIAAEALCTLAGVAAAMGSPARSARLWGGAEALLESIHSVFSSLEMRIHERLVAKVREESEEEFDGARAAGRAMAVTEIVTYALTGLTQGEREAQPALAADAGQPR